MLHNYLDCKIFSKGEEVEKCYKPDILSNKGNYFIIESENCSSRKTFVGCLLKASHFVTGARQRILISVIAPKQNTKAESIALHPKKYFEFISTISKLRNVYVIEVDNGSDFKLILKNEIENRFMDYFFSTLFDSIGEEIEDNVGQFVGYRPNFF